MDYPSTNGKNSKWQYAMERVMFHQRMDTKKRKGERMIQRGHQILEEVRVERQLRDELYPKPEGPGPTINGKAWTDTPEDDTYMWPNEKGGGDPWWE